MAHTNHTTREPGRVLFKLQFHYSFVRLQYVAVQIYVEFKHIALKLEESYLRKRFVLPLSVNVAYFIAQCCLHCSDTGVWAGSE